jgi:hypothetical protein
MRGWISVLFGAAGAVIFTGWLGLYADMRELPRWADIWLTAPVTGIASFAGHVLFHGKADAEGLFVPVAVLYCASIGALAGFGASALFPKRRNDAG